MIGKTEIAGGKTLFSRTLFKLRTARHELRDTALADLWHRNGLDNPKLRQGYKIAETEMVHKNGVEVVEYRLYKLVDASRTVLSADIVPKIEPIDSTGGDEAGVGEN